MSLGEGTSGPWEGPLLSVQVFGTEGDMAVFAGIREPVQKFLCPSGLAVGVCHHEPQAHTGTVTRGSLGFRESHVVLFWILADSTRQRIVPCHFLFLCPLPSFPRGSFMSVPLTCLLTLGKPSSKSSSPGDSSGSDVGSGLGPCRSGEPSQLEVEVRPLARAHLPRRGHAHGGGERWLRVW